VKGRLPRLVPVFVAVFSVVLAVAVVRAQPPGRGGGVLDDSASVAPAEIQRMFDAYALVQAQDALKLSDEQYPQFLARYKALQEVRRRGQSERARILRDLLRLSAPDRKSDDAKLRDGLKAQQDFDARTAAEVRKAYDAIDQVLDVRQQARFRVFEEQMERRKLELVTRARQNNRANNRPNAGRRGQPNGLRREP
jgi:hypothetical protein